MQTTALFLVWDYFSMKNTFFLPLFPGFLYNRFFRLLVNMQILQYCKMQLSYPKT